MNVLLIGGTGVISSEVCKIFLDNGIDVETFTRGNRTNLLDSRANNTIVDISDKSALNHAIKGKKYDCVIDFLVGIPRNVKEMLETLKGICETYILISSATVFSPTDDEITEESEIGNRSWDYASNKEDSEEWLKEHSKEFVNHFMIVRPYVTFSKQRLLYALIPHDQYSLLNRIKNEKAIPIQDGGEIKFSVTHARDFAQALLLLIKGNNIDDSFNIVSNHVITWKYALEMIYAGMDKQPSIVNVPSDIITYLFFPPTYSQLFSYCQN